MRTGPRNLITDVPGLKVGNAEDHHIKTGTSVLTADAPFVVGVSVMGGSPGTRETDLLAPDKAVEQIDALVLSGGSALGLDAASGVVDGLLANGRGFRVGPATVPIVPAAILFDLINGGDKNWGQNPYRALGRRAYDSAATDFALGSVGAGTGATTAGLKGGLGSASLDLGNGIIVGALVAANPTGQVVHGGAGQFFAAPFELDHEFGGLGVPTGPFDLDDLERVKGDFFDPVGKGQGGNTTIGIVATNARLTNAQCRRFAVAAHDGFARAIVPAHTPIDGDLIFGMSTGDVALGDPLADLVRIGHAGAVCMARAIARAVYEAAPQPNDPFPTWTGRFGEKSGAV